MKKSRPPTYRQLHQLLLGLGFTAESPEAHVQAYRHADSNTLILLAPHQPDVAARDADLISMRKHLVEKGLIDVRALDRLLKAMAATPE